MPITPFLGGERFDPEVKRVMGLAYEMARAALRLADGRDFLAETVAKTVIDLARAGERDPNRLCELTLERLGHSRHRGRDSVRRFVSRTAVVRRILQLAGDVPAACALVGHEPRVVPEWSNSDDVDHGRAAARA
jgi:hypothetical protein